VTIFALNLNHGRVRPPDSNTIQRKTTESAYLLWQNAIKGVISTLSMRELNMKLNQPLVPCRTSSMRNGGLKKSNKT